MDNTEGEPGSVYLSDLDIGLIIHTSKGLISIIEIMKEGKKKMNIKDFLMGNRIMKGEFFG